MVGGIRDRVFGAVADVGLRRPFVLLGIVGLLMVVSGLLVPGLGVSTSRTSLVSEEDPQQAALIDFYDRFGRPDSAVFVVSGGDTTQRRALVDRLQEKLEAEEAFAGRVLGHVGPRSIASLLLLQKPDALVELRKGMPPGVDLGALIEGGVPAWLGAIEDQIYAKLDGTEQGGADEEAADEEEVDAEAATAAPTEAVPSGEAPANPMADVDEGLRGLAKMATLLETVLVGGDLMAQLPTEGDEGESMAQPGLDDGGYLITADGENHLVSVFAELPSDEAVEVAPVVERLRAIRDEVMVDAPDGVRADLTGMPALITDELEIVQTGLLQSTVATTLGIALLCLLLFRSVRQTIVALIPLGPGVVATLAVVRLLYQDLNLITASFVAVLLGLGIDFSVHVISRFNEELRAGATSQEAVRAAVMQVGPGVLTGAVVTAAAFLTSATTEFTAFGELGVVTAAGLIIVAMCTFALLPALMRKAKGQTRVAPEPPGLAAVPAVLRKLRWPLVVVGVVVAIVGALTLPRIEFNPRYFDFLPESTEASRALTRLEYDPLASPVFANMRADSIDEARAMTEKLRALDSVAGVQTATDVLPPLEADGLEALRAGFEGLSTPDFEALAARSTTPEELASAADKVADALDETRLAMVGAQMPVVAIDEAIAAFRSLRDRAKELDDAGKARLATLEADAAAVLGPAWSTASAVAKRGDYAPEDLPPLFARRYVSKDGSQLALYVVPSGLFWERDVAERFRLDMVEIDPLVSGLATVHVRHGEIVVDGFRRAAGMAAVLVLLILTLDFRSLKDAVLALVPTVVGWLWMVGIMVVLGMRFDVANVVSMPLVLGIGIAFGVHMMHRCREVEAEGLPMEERLDKVVRGTGGAIAVAALTTMVGFGGLTMADYGGMKSFGNLMMIGIGTCLVATLIVLPAVLLVMRRVR